MFLELTSADNEILETLNYEITVDDYESKRYPSVDLNEFYSNLMPIYL